MSDAHEAGRVAALRAFLRACRDRAKAPSNGGMRQRDVAAAAGISLSLYKRLESGEARKVRFDTLVRVASALGLGPSEQACLLAMARPDLARLTRAPGSTGPSPALLGALRATSLALARSRDAEELCRIAGRSLAGLLGDDATVLLLHPAGGARLEVMLRFRLAGVAHPSLRDLSVPVPAAMRQGQTALVRLPEGSPSENAPIASLVLVPVCVGGELVVALGLATATGSDRPAQIAVVETVSALLEAALANLEPHR